VGIEPTTVGFVEVPRTFTTPQTPRSFFLLASLLHYFFASFAHTNTVALNDSHPSAKSACPKNPGGIAAHGLSGFEPEPFGLSTEVTVNFTIPGTCFSRQNLLIERFTPALQLGVFNSRLQFHRQAKTLERRIVLDRNDLGCFLRVA
jgi:hypothetical protein